MKFKNFSSIMALCSILFLTACGGGRDISSVETAIIGHWVSESEDPEYEDVHYYVSEDKLTVVEEGTKSVSDYKISSTNEKEQWIEIIVESREDLGSLLKRLEFTNDEMTELVNPIKMSDVIVSSDRADSNETQAFFDLAENLLGDTEFTSNWKYVDDLTEPK